MHILIADDHALFRKGVIQLIQELDDHIDTTEASNHVEAFAEIENNPKIELVLYDLNMTGMNGIDALIDIAKRYPSLPVIIISSSEDPKDLRKSIEAGAMGYITKAEECIVILNAIKLVLSGGIYISPSIMNKKNRYEMVDEKISNNLTQRQKEVLSFIIKGDSNKQIARTLEISDATIRVHLKSIYKILGVNNRTKAAMMAKNLDIQRD